jgi:hypothetical protein
MWSGDNRNLDPSWPPCVVRVRLRLGVMADLAVHASTDDPSLSSHGLRARHHEVINMRVEPMRMADRCPICSVRPTDLPHMILRLTVLRNEGDDV